VEVAEVRRIGEDREKGREVVWVRLGNEEQKWEVMEKKRKLRGRRERIGEDLTWKERKMRWMLGEIARKEEEKGKRVDRGNVKELQRVEGGEERKGDGEGGRRRGREGGRLLEGGSGT